MALHCDLRMIVVANRNRGNLSPLPIRYNTARGDGPTNLTTHTHTHTMRDNWSLVSVPIVCECAN